MEYIFPEFQYIAVNPEVFTGKPHIHGTRITVTAILAYLAGGMSIEIMLDEFPRLSREAIYEALAYASKNMQDDQFIPLAKAS
jgi:uncharacterized protein (DUF433 family)